MSKSLKKEEIEKLKKQGAAAAPQIIMKQQVTGEYCEVLPDLWRLMKKHDQVDEENMDYMACNDKHGELGFLKKFSKLDPRTANDYKIMFEQAIQRESQKSLKLGIIKGRKEGILEGLKEGIIKGKKEGRIKAIQDFLKEGLITKEQAEKKIQQLKAKKHN